MCAVKVVPINLYTFTIDTCVLASFVLQREHTMRFHVLKANSSEPVLVSLGLQAEGMVHMLSVLLRCLEPSAAIALA